MEKEITAHQLLCRHEFKKGICVYCKWEEADMKEE